MSNFWTCKSTSKLQTNNKSKQLFPLFAVKKKYINKKKPKKHTSKF